MHRDLDYLAKELGIDIDSPTFAADIMNIVTTHSDRTKQMEEELKAFGIVNQNQAVEITKLRMELNSLKSTNLGSPKKPESLRFGTARFGAPPQL